MIDEGAGYVVVALVKGHSAADFAKVILDHCVAWAGPPDVIFADAERGLASEEFVHEIAKTGCQYIPPAAYSPWQKGRVERTNATMRSIIRKSVLHLGLTGQDDMRLAAYEAASAYN